MTVPYPSSDDPLQELDQLARFLRKPRPRPFRPSVLAEEAVVRLTAQAKISGPEVFKRARQDLLAAHALTARDGALRPVEGRITSGLRALAVALAAGDTTLHQALPEARTVLDGALTDAYIAGAQSIDSDYTDVPPDDVADVADRIQSESSYLLTFLAAAAAGVVDDSALARRLPLWAAQARGAYEQGKGAGALSLRDAEDEEDPETDSTRGSRHRLIGDAIGGAAALAGAFSTDEEPSFIWVAVGDKYTCDFCDEQDGQEFTVSELDDLGWPGDGSFGDSSSGCAGGPNCRCIAIPSSWLKTARLRLLRFPVPSVTKYSDDQPRDDQGRWTAGGGGETTAGRVFSSGTAAQQWGEEHYGSTWLRQLTSEQVFAIQDYKAFGFAAMNRSLRGIRASDSPETTALVTNAFDTIFADHAVLPDALHVYRGASGAALGLDPANPQALVGTRITDKGFVSTTADRAQADRFTKGGTKANPTILIELDLPAGSKGIYMDGTAVSKNQKEREVLLPRNSTFEVTSVERGDKNVFTVRMNVLEEPTYRQPLGYHTSTTSTSASEFDRAYVVRHPDGSPALGKLVTASGDNLTIAYMHDAKRYQTSILRKDALYAVP